MFFFFFKQKTAYEMRISDWSSDVCSSDLYIGLVGGHAALLTDARLAVVARGLRRTVIAGRGVVIIVPASGGDERQREERCHPPQLVSLHLRSPNLLGHTCNGRAYLIWWTLTPSR